MGSGNDCDLDLQVHSHNIQEIVVLLTGRVATGLGQLSTPPAFCMGA